MTDDDEKDEQNSKDDDNKGIRSDFPITYLWRLERVISWEVDGKEKHSTLVRTIRL